MSLTATTTGHVPRSSSWSALHLEERKQQQQQQPRMASRYLRTPSDVRIPSDERHSGGEQEEDTRWEDFVRPKTPCDDLPDFYTTCGVTEFYCSPADEDLRVLFQYDVHVIPSRVTDESVRDVVGERIFFGTAVELRIDDCVMIFGDQQVQEAGGGEDEEHNNNIRNRRRLALLGPNLGVRGLKALPDEVERPGGCLSEGPEGTKCLAVQGGFTVHGGSNVSDMLGLFMEYVRSQMEDDAYIEPSFIEKVVFVGEGHLGEDGQKGDEDGHGEGEGGQGNYEDTTQITPTVPTSSGAPPGNDTGEDTPPPNTDKLVDLSDPPGTTTDRSGATTMLVVAAAGLAVIVLFAFLGISKFRSKKRNNQNSEIREMIEDPEYIFDVTDNSPPKGRLAEKDSLALAPQPDMAAADMEGRQPVNMVRNIDNEKSFASESEESGSDSDETGPDAEEDEEVDEAELQLNTGLQSYPDTLPGRRTVAVGASLSLIQEEGETQEQEDHNLDFEEILSTASYDTRSSARRVLQMT